LQACVCVRVGASVCAHVFVCAHVSVCVGVRACTLCRCCPVLQDLFEDAADQAAVLRLRRASAVAAAAVAGSAVEEGTSPPHAEPGPDGTACLVSASSSPTPPLPRERSVALAACTCSPLPPFVEEAWWWEVVIFFNLSIRLLVPSCGALPACLAGAAGIRVPFSAGPPADGPVETTTGTAEDAGPRSRTPPPPSAAAGAASRRGGSADESERCLSVSGMWVAGQGVGLPLLSLTTASPTALGAGVGHAALHSGGGRATSPARPATFGTASDSPGANTRSLSSDAKPHAGGGDAVYV
jgi:hypothetical protein